MGLKHNLVVINSSLRLGDLFTIPSGVVFTSRVIADGELEEIVSKGTVGVGLPPNVFWGKVRNKAHKFWPYGPNKLARNGKYAFHISEVEEILFVPDRVPHFDQWERSP